MTTAIVLATKDEAQALTKRIRAGLADRVRNAETVLGLLREAEEREVWKSLGYRSLGGYLSTEFGMSRSNAYRMLDVRTVQKSVPRGTESDHLPTQREAERITAPLKQKRAKRGMPDKTTVINAIATALDNFESKSDGYEDEEIVSYLSHDERRALERAVEKASAFAERWGDLLTRPVERRYVEESA